MPIDLTDFQTTQPLAAQFFTEALSANHLVNSYLLCGKDIPASYNMALRLAQIINCTEKPNNVSACGNCQTCRWIENNAHPWVITLSNLTYSTNLDPKTGLPKAKGTKPPEKIVVEQLENLLNALGLQSGGFHRVVILCAAEEKADIETGPVKAPQDWLSSDDGQFVPISLDHKNFADVASNKFLKTLEEPPHDVIFFLLAESEDKLLETIVSRCQRIPFEIPQGFYDVELSQKARDTFRFLLSRQVDYLENTKAFNTFLEEEKLSTENGLVQFQSFLRDALYSTTQESQFRFIKHQLKQVDSARRMIRDRVREESVLEDCFLSLASA